MAGAHILESRLSLIIAIICCGRLLPSGGKADSILGNLPTGGGAYTISTEAGNTFGLAAEFTPQQGVTFNSITLWVSGYTGLDGSSLQLSLMQDGTSLDFPGPTTTIAMGTAAPNDGSDAALTFSLQGQLQSSLSYWLFLYLQVPNGGTGPNYGNYNCLWDQDGDPIGNIQVDGSKQFTDGFIPSSFQSHAPAFAINTVPEPPAAAMLVISLGVCFWARRKMARRSPQIKPLRSLFGSF